MKSKKMLESANREYKSIEMAIRSLLKGEIKGEEAERIINVSLDHVDALIGEYKSPIDRK